jgi:hypothetical protein
MNVAFRKARLGPVLSRDEGVRQGLAVKAALAALGAEARSFLNSHHAGLRGRPLDLAVASAAGLQAVEAELRTGADVRPSTAQRSF